MDLVSLNTAAAVTAAGVVIRTWVQAHYLDKMHSRECQLQRDLARSAEDGPAPQAEVAMEAIGQSQ